MPILPDAIGPNPPRLSPWLDATLRRIQPLASVLPSGWRQGFATPGYARP